MGNGLACIVDPGRAPEHILYSMFLHGGWMHILGNMWFFWIFGNNVEDSMGRTRFLVFYLLCGGGAGAAQGAVKPGAVVPLGGASGGIRGGVGAHGGVFPP